MTFVTVTIFTLDQIDSGVVGGMDWNGGQIVARFLVGDIEREY